VDPRHILVICKIIDKKSNCDSLFSESLSDHSPHSLIKFSNDKIDDLLSNCSDKCVYLFVDNDRFTPK
jgi:hypothetical protein